MSPRSLIQGIEVPAIQGCHNRVTEVREDVAEVEGKSAANLEKIIGQPTEVACLGTQYDDEICVLAAVPAGAEPRLISIAERDVIFKRDQLESTLADAFENPFFKEESVRVGHQGESGDLRGELAQNQAAPCFCAR
jgi:hypothetical protein